MALHQSCNSRPAFPKFDKDALKFAKKKMKKLKRLKSHTNLNKSRMGLKSYRSKILENEGVLSTVLAKISLIQPSTSLGKDPQQRLSGCKDCRNTMFGFRLNHCFELETRFVLRVWSLPSGWIQPRAIRLRMTTCRFNLWRFW